jgi:uncharacterized protein involved in exopolysaccharide biosynthesis
MSGRWWIFGSIAVCTICSVVFAMLSPPIYRASAILMPAVSERDGLRGSLNGALGQLSGLASLAGVGAGGGNAETVESLAVLRSRQFTESFIKDKDLIPQLAVSQWKIFAPLSTEKNQSAAKAFHYFDKKIRTINQDAKTGLITLLVDWKNPAEAADWANELVTRANSEMRRRAIAKADASVGFLEAERAATIDLATRESINHLIESEIKQRMLANVSPEYAFRVIDKAMVPDKDDLAPPRKLVVALAGPPIGLLVGVALVLLYARLKRRNLRN